MRWIITGKNLDGSHIEGKVEAISEQHAIQRLLRRGITVVSIVAAESHTGPPPIPPTEPNHDPIPAVTGPVFISHSNLDAAPANEIVLALEAQGIKCWIAPRDILPGSNWIEAITKALGACTAVILIYSRNVVESDPVVREVNQAVSAHLPVIPIRLENTKPSTLDFLVKIFHWIDAFPAPVSRHIPAIAAGVRRALGMGSQSPVPVRPEIPKYIGRYRILGQIDDRGMCTVFKAEQAEPVKRMVALKVVKADVNFDEIMSRFAYESQSLARLNHPHIARILDADTSEQGRPYFVTEFAPGKPITEFADENKLTIRQRLELFLQVCDAVAHAHSKSVLHLGIKPTNVLANMPEDKPFARVMGFGYAMAMGRDRRLDEAVIAKHQPGGSTYAAMAREQAEGAQDVDTRSDVYSLGVLLYELLVGASPFDLEALERASDAEARQMVREFDPTSPSDRLKALGEKGNTAAECRATTVEALYRDLRRELEWIPQMAMQKERQRRYASPLLLAEDIQNYLQYKPLIASQKGAVYQFRKFARRNRVMLTGIAVIAVMASLGIGIYIHDINQAERKTQAALAEAASVNRFISNMLTSATPKGKNKATIADAINDFTWQLDSNSSEDPPQVAASIRDLIGDVQRALQEYDNSDTNLTLALELRRQALNGADDDAEVAKILDHRGHLLKDRLKHQPEHKGDQAMFAESLASYDKALDILRKTQPANDLSIAQALADRAQLFLTPTTGNKISEKNLASANADATEALSIRMANVKSKKLEPDGEDILQAKSALVQILIAQGMVKGDFTQAARESAGAVRIASHSHLGPDHVAIARAHLDQGDVLMAEGDTQHGTALAATKYSAALREYDDAWEMDKRVLGKIPTHNYFTNCRKKVNDCLGKLIPILENEDGKTSEVTEANAQWRKVKEEIKEFDAPTAG